MKNFTYILIAFAVLYFGSHLIAFVFTPWVLVVENQTYHTVMAEVTAYSEIDSCHYKGCPMANGDRARVGAIACPRHIKLGTYVEILGLLYECADRTAKWVDGRYDIFIGYGKDAYKEALAWGVKTVEVKIVYAETSAY